MSREERKETFRRERGTVLKKWTNRVPVCVAYPNTYYIGMSNLAVHLLYRELNSRPEVVCERVFLVPGAKPLSVESGRPLSAFEVVFFTLSFEMDYPNVVAMLRDSSIPVHSRGEGTRRPPYRGRRHLRHGQPRADEPVLRPLHHGRRGVVPAAFYGKVSPGKEEKKGGGDRRALLLDVGLQPCPSRRRLWGGRDRAGIRASFFSRGSRAIQGEGPRHFGDNGGRHGIRRHAPRGRRQGLSFRVRLLPRREHLSLHRRQARPHRQAT